MINDLKKHSVRSYVLRNNRMTPIQKNAISTYWSNFGIETPTSTLELNQIFERQSSKRILEIGFGKGGSLIQMARDCPEYDFLGIEVHQPGIGSLLSAIINEEISNIRIIKADANEVFPYLPNHSFKQIQIFFPDPWQKRRHHKRRLVQTDFIRAIIKKLQPNGFLYIATDWQDYAESIIKLMQEFSNFKVSNESFIKRPATHYEQRGRKLGHQIWDLIYHLTD